MLRWLREVINGGNVMSTGDIRKQSKTYIWAEGAEGYKFCCNFVRTSDQATGQSPIFWLSESLAIVNASFFLWYLPAGFCVYVALPARPDSGWARQQTCLDSAPTGQLAETKSLSEKGLTLSKTFITLTLASLNTPKYCRLPGITTLYYKQICY